MMKGRDGRNVYPESVQRKVRAAARDGSKTPVELDDQELRTLGHTKKSAARAIRQMCVSCFGGEGPQSAKADIAGCLSVGCAVWPFRFGRSPYHGKERVK
jgi:hypothetical protein